MSLDNMNGMAHLIHHGAEELQAIVQGTDPASGFIVALVGGVVRDQLHRITPRDIDIALIGSTPELVTQTLDILADLGWEMWETYDRDATNSYTKEFPEEENRFEAIIKLRRPLHPLIEKCDSLDLLVYDLRYDTIQDALDSFDHNIGQFAAWLGLSGKIECGFLGDNFGECYQLRHFVTPDRVMRIKEICLTMGWRYIGEDF